ncbi:fasciclin domain-containing protein [Hyaloscypha variabilis F]|uniref:Fasciclin domain-containing protein n=1 Tax=Hyaloscypha variabilis (strain UAMH 11265 / GT02V1 / F) TaxID=1149755 RepID=A0A2J6QUX4_HYAVF|nr:fasciclin domain-containing protein [Hyaloscypha variabilis F]
MRHFGWQSLVATSLGLFIAGLQAQTLDSVLAGETDVSTFYSLIQKYPDILNGLPSGGATVLAPNNAAFVRNAQFVKNSPDFITSVLQYHVLQDTVLAKNLVAGAPIFTDTLLASWTNITGGIRVEMLVQGGDVVALIGGQGSRSTLITADLPFTGGVVQIIDSLLVPPGNITTTCQEYNFTSFEGALYAADLLTSDSSTSNLTIFAPQNAAFQAIGSAITSMSSSDLAKIMNFHTIPNQVLYSPSLKNNSVLTTLEGGKLTITRADNNAVYINSAQILAPDIMIGNGVLHVIDNVLNPSSSGVPTETLATQLPVFASASSVSGLPFTSNIPAATTSVQSVATGNAQPTGVKSSSSKALAAKVARETGFKAGVMAVIGGAAMLL